MPGNNRIVFVANTSWSIYRFRLYVIKQLISSGYKVYVLAPRDRYTANFENLEGLQFIPITNFENNRIAPYKDWLLYRELKRSYRDIDPAIIFHYTIKANICGTLAAGKKYRSISVITGLGYAFLKNSFFQSLAATLYSRSLKFANQVWFLNRDDKEAFVSKNFVDNSRAFVLPGEGVDTDFFLPSPLRRSETTRFLLIARLTKHKGVYEFVEAVRSLRSRGLKTEGLILGKFDEESPASVSKKQLDQWTAEGIIKYLGETDDVSGFIADAECIVLPSYREGLPLSLLEGASMGRALIATNTAGCRDVVEEGYNGYLCRPQDAADLAGKMEKFHNLSDLQKQQMGGNGREKILHSFRKEIIAEIYREKIAKLLA
jgi:glycosyltransferase involved in cell wall biosynthesis